MNQTGRNLTRSEAESPAVSLHALVSRGARFRFPGQEPEPLVPQGPAHRAILLLPWTEIAKLPPTTMLYHLKGDSEKAADVLLRHAATAELSTWGLFLPRPEISEACNLAVSGEVSRLAFKISPVEWLLRIPLTELAGLEEGLVLRYSPRDQKGSQLVQVGLDYLTRRPARAGMSCYLLNTRLPKIEQASETAPARLSRPATPSEEMAELLSVFPPGRMPLIGPGETFLSQIEFLKRHIPRGQKTLALIVGAINESFRSSTPDMAAAAGRGLRFLTPKGQAYVAFLRSNRGARGWAVKEAAFEEIVKAFSSAEVQAEDSARGIH